jgi:predicted choloylglycine hydrolase
MDILKSPQGKTRSEEYLRLTRKYYPEIYEEIRGMADGAGLHFDAVWAMGIKSELGALEKEPTGCSTIYFKNEQHMWLFHNEDGNQAYRDIMFVLKATPPSGVTYLSMVYPGIITGNGPSMNSRGIIQSTNYIGSTTSEVGIPRYIIGRAVLEARDLKEAQDIITMEPRAYPYHHNIGSFTDQQYISLETTPESWQHQEPSGVYYHTNHLLFDKTKDYQAEDRKYKQSSSMSRFEVINQEIPRLPEENDSPDDFLKILSSHANAPYSPCRHPEGDVKGQTLGLAMFDFIEKKMRLYKGNPCIATRESLFMDVKLDSLE